MMQLKCDCGIFWFKPRTLGDIKFRFCCCCLIIIWLIVFEVIIEMFALSCFLFALFWSYLLYVWRDEYKLFCFERSIECWFMLFFLFRKNLFSKRKFQGFDYWHDVLCWAMSLEWIGLISILSLRSTEFRKKINRKFYV
jgi:hypothetical protein